MMNPGIFTVRSKYAKFRYLAVLVFLFPFSAVKAQFPENIDVTSDDSIKIWESPEYIFVILGLLLFIYFLYKWSGKWLRKRDDARGSGKNDRKQ